MKKNSQLVDRTKFPSFIKNLQLFLNIPTKICQRVKKLFCQKYQLCQFAENYCDVIVAIFQTLWRHCAG